MKSWRWIIGASVLQFSMTVLVAQPCSFTEDTFDDISGGSYGGSCTLSVGGNVTINGPVEWTSGTLQILGSDGNITIANGGSLTITGGSIEAIDGDNGRIIVNSGGTLTVADGASIASFAYITVSGLLQIDGTFTIQDGRLDVTNSGVINVGVTGFLDIAGTGDNEIDGSLNVAGRIQTAADIEVTGSLQVSNEGYISSVGTVDIEVYNGGSVVVAEGGSINASGSINTTTAGCTAPSCEPGGTFDIRGTLVVGGHVTIGSTTPVSSLNISSTGFLNIVGTGEGNDNVIAGDLSIAGTVQTSSDIEINGGSLQVSDGGEIVSGGAGIDLEVYNAGSVLITEGGSIDLTGSINTTTAGCSCTPGGTFDISGELDVGGNITIGNTTPNSSFTSSDHTGDITIGGTFQDNECATYDADDYHYCACNGQSGTTCSAALPVELISFLGFQRGRAILLQWTTASETNNDFFTIERLTEADSFAEVSNVSGAGTSTNEKHYSTLDLAPQPGRNYYRLKQTDFDKTVSYSSLIAIEYEWCEKELTVWPNPCANGSVFIHCKNLVPNEAIVITIKDNRGVQYFTSQHETDAGGTFERELNINSLAAGMYIVQAGTLYSKLIISK